VSDNSVLLVDDDSDVLQAIGTRCRAAGYSVRVAHNLLTATTLVQRARPDLICIDVQMPTGNGLRFCQSLAANPDSSDIPIIVLTAHTDAETQRRCQELGAHFLAKRPDVWKDLEPMLQKLVGKAEGKERKADNAFSTDATQRALSARPAAVSRTIVIADDDVDLVDLLTQRCTHLGCSVIGVHNTIDALNVIHRAMPDLVCIDVNMPAGNGLSVCEMMAADERLRSIPVIVLTGICDEQTIRRCHDMLIYYVEKNADVWSRLEPVIRELLLQADELRREPRATAAGGLAPTPPNPKTKPMLTSAKNASTSPAENSLMDAVFAMLGADALPTHPQSPHASDQAAPPRSEEEPPWVLCIDDDADFSDALKCRLESYGVAVIRAFSGMEGYRLAFTSPASAILLDHNMPNGQGDYVLRRLRENPVTRDIPVIVLTGIRDKSLERKMYGLGAKSYLTKPIEFETLRDELAKHIEILAAPAT
jgi:CheY-like chemotaxis protein